MRESKTASAPLVSVIVTTKNEERNIETCLSSLRSQTYGPIEIIVVDNGSTDRTKEIALRHTDKVFDRGPERSAQRNYGMMTVAQGDYVIFIDADMILSPDLIEACVQRMARQDCVALHIPEIVLGSSFFGGVRRFERTFYDGTAIDAARLCRRDVFMKVGGFDESLTGVEDWDIDKKIKRVGSIGLLNEKPAGILDHPWEFSPFIRERGVEPDDFPAVIFHNESNFHLRQYLKKKKYYTGWFDAYVEKWGRGDPDIRRQFGFGYRYFGVFIENGKWKKILRHPVLTLGMYFLRFLVGVVYLWDRPRT